jgi:hypothetical protein
MMNGGGTSEDYRWKLRKWEEGLRSLAKHLVRRFAVRRRETMEGIGSESELLLLRLRVGFLGIGELAWYVQRKILVYLNESRVGLILSRWKLPMWGGLKTMSEDLVRYLHSKVILVVSQEVQVDL